jgi:hypothetical protein
MKFDGICDESIKTPTDLLRFLLTPRSKEFSDTELRTVYKAISLVDLKEQRDNARGMMLSIQSSKNPGYEAAGVIYLRLCELKNPGMTEQDRLLQAIDLVRCMTEISHPVLNSKILSVATGIYNFLAFRQPDHVELFTDSIIAVPENDNRNRMVVKMVGGNPTNPTINTKPFRDALYKSIERKGDVKDWIKRNIPPRLRVAASEVTGFKEFLQTMGKADKGKFLEDQLGL